MKAKQEIKYHLSVLGCQMNKSDGERIRSVLDELSFKETKSKDDADLLIYVACSVRQSAMDKIYGQSAQWGKLREQGKIKTILTGCLTSLDQEKIDDRFDLVLPISDLMNWPSKIIGLFETVEKTPHKRDQSNPKTQNYLSLQSKHSSAFSAYVPIMTGCNNFCSYCVVPYTRGRELSRPAEEIISEIKGLIQKGYKEITLIGQNVNSYDGGVGFPKLLEMVNAIDGDFWIKFVSSHPKDASDNLIDTICKSEKACEYFHIAVQSGNDDILHKMNRKYTVESYKKLVSDIRSKIKKARKGVYKNAMISTDFIVGFPGETEDQFQDTAKLMKEIKFDMGYISRYSSRPGTVAEKLNDNVSPEEKQRREHILLDILRATALENNQVYLDKEIRILVEGKAKLKNEYVGKTRTFKNVSFVCDKNLIGQFVKIKITKAGIWGLNGKLIA